MGTIFSYIIQKRLSQANEDVATDALCYILEASPAARAGMMRLLRGIVPELPDLRFKTQQSEGAIRPDMWGFVESQPRVFVENKFWAGLTDNQPAAYLEQLSHYPQPTLLLVIAPAEREQVLWRELRRRAAAAGIGLESGRAASGIPCCAVTAQGSALALTSWTHVLSVLEHACSDDPGARADLVQLRALCESADTDAFFPLSRAELTDQQVPALVLRLGRAVEAAARAADARRVASIAGLRPQANWNRIGRYLRLPGDGSGRGAGAWFGIDFALWRAHGTPLWLIFDGGSFGRAQEVQPLLEPWSALQGLASASGDRWVAVAQKVPPGEELDQVVEALTEGLRAVASLLESVPPSGKAGPDPGQEDVLPP